MKIQTSSKTFLVFDLDDTLYKEIDFLKSAFYFISKYYQNYDINIYNEMLNLQNKGMNVFEYLISKYPSVHLSKKDLMRLYREHIPNIRLSDDVEKFLANLKNKNIRSGLITDGRSLTQRNKLKALNIDDFFEFEVISEEFGSNKKDIKNFKIFEDKFGLNNYYYIGNDLSKDFFNPNSLGWKTIGLKDLGFNIHSQNINLPIEYLPNMGFVNSFDDIELI